MVDKWEGVDRRKLNMNNEDHDLLIKINQNIENLLTNFNLHVQSDNVTFREIKARTINLERIVWMGLGALAILNVFLKVVK